MHADMYVYQYMYAHIYFSLSFGHPYIHLHISRWKLYYRTGLRLSLHAASLELKFPSGLDSYIEVDLMRELNCLRICTMIATGWELLYVVISLSTNIVLLIKQRSTQRRLVLRKLIQPLFVNCSPMLLPREFLAPSLQTKPCGWMPAVSLGSYIYRAFYFLDP